MAGRSHPTFQKRLKEQARKDKQRLKAERKAQRKLEKTTSLSGPDSDIPAESTNGEPETIPLPDPVE